MYSQDDGLYFKYIKMYALTIIIIIFTLKMLSHFSVYVLFSYEITEILSALCRVQTSCNCKVMYILYFQQHIYNYVTTVIVFAVN